MPAKRAELEKIEAQASAPDFWSDQDAAQKLLQQRSRLERIVKRQEQFESEISDAGVLFEFAEEDEGSGTELRSLLSRLEVELDEAETEMLLAGENDRPDISQGLAKVYLRFKEAGVSAELHILAGIGHGFGLRAGFGP